MKWILNLLLCAVLMLTPIPTLAASGQTEQKTAASWLKENGIMTGDQSGNMNLNAGLTRAELAVILTRLTDTTGDMSRNSAYYRTICRFTDVPEWAMPYAGYCAQKHLMSGYGNKVFGSNDPVTPAAACTVMLRYLEYPSNQWSYATACDKAAELGLLPVGAEAGKSITRGNVAILIYRAMTGNRPDLGSAAPQRVENSHLTNGKPITEENVLELLCQLEAEWPTGTPWGDPELNPDTRRNTVPSAESGKLMRSYRTNGTYGCGGYASMISSLIFGSQTNPCHRVEDLTQIRPGDIIFRVSNATGKVWHVTVALESPNDVRAYHVTDGNRNGVVYWPDRDNPYGRENLDSYGEDKSHHLEVWTRYPESVPCTGNSVGAWPTGITEEKI